MRKTNPNSLKQIAASDLVSASVFASLIGELAGKEILSQEQVRDIYDNALLLLEEQQAIINDSTLDDIYESACAVL